MGYISISRVVYGGGWIILCCGVSRNSYIIETCVFCVALVVVWLVGGYE